MQKVFLGKLKLNWCKKCNLPVLSRICSCGAPASKVEITPPWDVRPAFSADIELINRTCIRQFGTSLIPDGVVVLLNKAPYDDRMDEIIVGGRVLGSIRYEVEKQDFVLLPRIDGAGIISAGSNDQSSASRSGGMPEGDVPKGIIIIDESAVPFILKGASLLAPGIKAVDIGIMAEDEVIIRSNDVGVVAVGRARMDGADMVGGKGMAVKVRFKGIPQPVDMSPHTMDDVVQANMGHIRELESTAHRFIKQTIETVGRPVSVSYSGGKDSLATLLLVKDVVFDFDVMFADTGLEFPETVDNVRQVALKYNLDIKCSSAESSFWDLVWQFGPPTVQARWCCKVCKLGPLTRLIEDNFDDGVLSFIGQRRYESHARSRSDPIWRNPWVGNQVGASPIQNWIALEVWLYIFHKGAPYNPAYEMGYDRIGCWLCPSASMADFAHLSRTHPDLHSKLDTFLSEYAKECGYPQQWKDFGLWRWQRLPKPQQMLAEKYGMDLVPKRRAQELRFSHVSGYRPCKAGGMSSEGSFNVSLDLEMLFEVGALLPVGKCTYMDGVIMVNPSGYGQAGLADDTGDTIDAQQSAVQVFASGTVVVRGRKESDVQKLMGRSKTAIHRALMCVGCGVCIGHCSTGAIRMEIPCSDDDSAPVSSTPRAVTGSECIHCGRCLGECPAVKFQA